MNIDLGAKFGKVGRFTSLTVLKTILNRHVSVRIFEENLFLHRLCRGKFL